jgi:uracil DNA glycosylase
VTCGGRLLIPNGGQLLDNESPKRFECNRIGEATSWSQIQDDGIPSLSKCFEIGKVTRWYRIRIVVLGQDDDYSHGGGDRLAANSKLSTWLLQQVSGRLQVGFRIDE